MEAHMSDTSDAVNQRLREHLSDHIWKFGWNAAEYNGDFGTREHCDHLAGLALEALSVTQVGRQCSRHGQGCHSRCSEPMEPVYRLGDTSGPGA
jgi:hypothetical protein